MNSYSGKSIGQLLKFCHGNKGGIIPKPILNQIEYLITSNSHKIYPYEILFIYDYLCKNKDKTAFQRIDSIVFPSKSIGY